MTTYAPVGVFEIEEGELGDGAAATAPPSPRAPWLQRARGRLPGWLGGATAPQPFERLSSEDSWAEARLRERWCPEERAGPLGRLLFTYVDGLLALGGQKSLLAGDLWDVAEEDAAGAVSAAFHRHLAAAADEAGAPAGAVWRAMWRAHRRRFLLAGAVKFVHDVVMLGGPLLLEVLLKHVQARGSGWVGLGLAAALAAAAALETLTVNLYFHLLFRICLHLKVGLVDMLYAKSLRITAAARSELGVGAVVNLQSNDAAKLWALPQYLHMVWSGPFQILAVMALLARVIRPAPAAVSLAVTVALIPLSAAASHVLAAVRRRVVALTDARVKLCSEVITGIKAIKLYAWERPYAARIGALRARELREVRTASLVGTCNNMLWVGGPILIAMAAFAAHSLLGYQMTATVAFPALALFNLMRFPVLMIPTQLLNLVNAKVALDRIQAFMEGEEMRQAAALPAGDPALEVRRGDFSWGAASPVLLRGVELRVARGRLVMVVGAVGSGKSSLLAALLGEMRARRGAQVAVRGSTAYTQQDPWIQNATLRENILLGAPLDAARYAAVLAACALLPDLTLLPAGDDTEIGEKGVNLSGGQRHRVALARAAYADADVYLLDDPLSAVDAHVGRHLFDACVLGLLRSKTRVLATHQLQYLPAADEVLVMREGRVAERGTHAELAARGVDFHELVMEAGQGEEAGAAPAEANGGGGGGGGGGTLAALAAGAGAAGGSRRASLEGGGAAAAAPSSPDDELVDVPLQDACVAAQTAAVELPPRPRPPPPPPPPPANGAHAPPLRSSSSSSPGGGASPRSPKIAAASAEPSPTTKEAAARRAASAQLTRAEERAVGRVDRRVYLRYFAAWGPAFLVPGAVLALGLTERGLQAGQNWWLSVWAEAMPGSGSADGAEGAAPGRPASFYMNVYFGLGFVSLGFQVVKAVVLVLGSVHAAGALQASLLATVLRLPMSFFDAQPTGRLLNRFTKDTEAVDTSLQSSISSFLNCAVSVVWSLVVVVAVSPSVALAILPLGWAYSRVQARYIATSRELKRLDSLAMSPIFGHFSASLQGLPTLRAFRAQPRFEARNRALLDESNRAYWPAQCVNRWLSVRLELLGIGVVFGTAAAVSAAAPTSAGLAGLALTSALNLTGLMNWMVRQTTELEVNMNSVERLMEYDAQPPEAADVVPARRPLPGWPHHGAISVEQLVVSYRPELGPVLHGITFAVAPREKVGVAGRTGCGKSTLMMALCRIVEPQSGRVVIDGIDTSTIGLLDLRSRLALVPQDPVLFSGSVRSNLDPFGAAAGGDAGLWSALERAGVAPAVRAMPGGLDADVAEGGGNLSAGQRQLLCMARALLRAARVLILDEATSSIDNATDAGVQATVAAAFADCTVLTIAHRLHTIVGSDRVLVLDGGRVQEFDAPAALLRKQGGAFRALVEETARHHGAQ